MAKYNIRGNFNQASDDQVLKEFMSSDSTLYEQYKVL